MNIKILITIFILFNCNQAFSQEWVRDSLTKLQAQAPKDSYEEIDILLAWTRLLGFEGYDEKAVEYARRAVKIAKKIGYREGEARACVYESMSATRFEGSDKTILILEKGLKISQEIGAKNVEVFALYNYAEHFLYHKNNFNRTLEILEQAISRFDETVSHKNKGNVYKVLGLCFDDFGQPEKGLEAYKKALYHFEQVGKNPFIDPILKHPNADAMDGGLLNQGQILIYLGRAYLKKGETKIAKDYILRAKKLYEEANIASNIAWSHEYLARIAEHIGDYESVIQNLQKALIIYQESGDKHYASDILKSFGSIYQKLNDIEQAKTFYQKAIDIDKSLADTLSLIRSYMNISSLKIAEQQPNAAMLDLTAALDFALAIQDSLNLPEIYQSIGQAWSLKNQPDSAIAYFQKSIPILESQKNYRLVLSAYLSLTDVFYNNQQLDKALQYATQTEQQLSQNGSLAQKRKTHQVLSKIYSAKEDFEKALHHYELFFTYHDSLYTENTQQIAKAERVRQNIDDYKAQQEAATLKAQLLASQNNLYLALAIGLLSLLVLGSYLFFQLRKNKQALEDKNQELANLNATKDKFFGIIAHDIRSPIIALDSVGEQMDYYLSKNNEQKLRRLAKSVDTTTKHLTNLLDNLLNWALLQTRMIPYQPKSLNLKAVSNTILELYEPIANTKNITIENNISTNKMVFADESALNTIIRNLVNNAIKFTPTAGTISLSDLEKDQPTLISIKDTGVGIPPEKLKNLFALERTSTKGTAGEKGSGLGLMLCKELVELNQGTIEVNSELGKGTTFTFSVPSKIS